MIINCMKEFERSGTESVQQSDIITRMSSKIELENAERGTSIEKAVETSRKVANVIQYMIHKENILMVTQDAKTKNERYISLNINVDLSSMD